MKLELTEKVDFLTDGSNIIVKGACFTNKRRDSVIIARIGDIVAGTDTVAGNPELAMGENSLINYSFTLSKSLLDNNVDHTFSIILINERITQIYTLTCQEVLKKSGFYAGLTFSDMVNLFPSLGFFGGGKNLPLEVAVKCKTKKLKVFIDEQNALLNISKIEVFDSNGEIITNLDGVKAKCSSIANKDKSAAELLKGNGFHSEREDNPWFLIKFPQKTELSKIKIYNRRDKWGIRSKHVAVSYEDKKGFFKPLYSNYVDPHNLRSLAEELKANLTLAELQSCLEGNAVSRLKLAHLIIQKCKSSSKYIDSFSKEFFEQFLSTWSSAQLNEAETEIEAELLAILIYKQTKTKLTYNLSAFSRILGTKSSLFKLQSALNHLRVQAELPRLQLTKHGIAVENKLSANSQRIISSAKELFKDLSELGLKPCLAYGTLLGAVREQAFIAHDDDVDLLIELPDTGLTLQTAFPKMRETLSKLDKTKYRFHSATKAGSALNFHVTLISTGVVLDVFPYWFDGDEAVLHMELLLLRKIPAAILKSRSKITFYGEEFPMPGKVEAFLEERYGPTWHTPDPFHEWLWTLQ